jgi:predicted HTH transcriptional regulator
MDERELLIQYIENQHECEWVDFKEKFYIIKHNKDCFIKDIVSFANNFQPKDKYIIFGVEDKSHDVCGVSPDTIPDN